MSSAALSRLLATLLAVSLSATGCGGPEGATPVCEDGMDNDEDGLTDGEDPSCAAGDDESGNDPTRDCNDAADNDDDGLVDYPEDPGCSNGQDNSELNSPTPQCDDGVDNDDDGLTDYPDDPGCFSGLQDSESDTCPDGVTCPECANGLDDDEDGDLDYPADDGCAAASDDQERVQDLTACQGSTTEVLPLDGMVTGSIVAGMQATITSTCGGAGVEKVYEIYVSDPVVMVATTALSGTVVDTVLYLRTRCADPATQLVCNDNTSATSTASTITATMEPGYYYLVVDGKNTNSVGTFVLSVDFFPGQGTACDPVMTDSCAPGLVCRTLDGASGPTCEEEVCSDGLDDDDDTLIDYPNDPGCASPSDPTEDDDCATTGITCPDCYNGDDDDGDDLIDFPLDTDCASASQLVEGCGDEQDGIVTITDDAYVGTTTGAHDDSTVSGSCGTTGGLDVVHFLTLPVAVSTMTVNTNSSTGVTDSVLYMDDASCDGVLVNDTVSPFTCDDDAGSPGFQSAQTFTNLAAGAYAITVDGYSSTYVGAYNLNIHATAVPSAACTDPLFAAGLLACPTTHPCNGSICAPPACGDAIDQDGDNDGTGFPNDPGCTSALDPDEEDLCPSGAGCPQCSNDLDDDMDLLFDYPADPNCASAAANTEACSDTDPLGTITMPTHTGSTTGLANNFSGTCISSAGPDKVFLLDLPVVTTTLNIDTVGTPFDTILMLKTAACEVGADIACDDQSGGAGTSRITRTNQAAGTYAIVVDGWLSSSHGNFTLNVSGTVGAGASCTSPLFASGVLACQSGEFCNGVACTPAACNDLVDDDGDGDGTGYPADPGCTSINDNTELDDCPDGPDCPQCGNDDDDDLDGMTDFPLDPSCAAASVDDESGCASATDPFAEIIAPTTTGNLDTENNDLAPGCLSPSGRDIAYLLDVPFPLQTLYIDTEGSTVNTTVAVRANSCTSADLACNDNGGDDGSDAYLVMSNVAPGRYAVIVDSAPNSTGAYTLHTRGVIAEGGSCDPVTAAAGLYACAAHTVCGGAAGNETCLPMACANGGDNDGDLLADALDPGCMSLADDDESPDPAVAPQCANGGDDDGDGLDNYPADNGCRRAADNLERLCVETSGILEITTARVTASTAGAGADSAPSCVPGAAAPDRAYSLTVPGMMTTLQFNASLATTGSFNNVIYVRRDQCATDLACADSGNTTIGSAAPGTYFVFIDGNGTAEGNFLLDINGVITAGQPCDPAQIQAGMFTCAGTTTCSHNVCQ